MVVDARMPAARREFPSTYSADPSKLPQDRVIRVLIVDDDPNIVDLLTTQFAKTGGFEVSSAADGRSGLEQARDQLPSLIILELVLPRMPGMEICKILKGQRETKNIPILVLTAKSEAIDRIVALEVGADDYVTKPFSPREVVLRAKAILRRRDRDVQEEPATIGGVTIDPSRGFVSVSGKPIQLTAVEFKLLRYLMHRRGRVEPRDRLLTEVWGYDHAVETRTIDTHILRLRKKLGKAGSSIETIRGFGYRFRAD